MNDRNLAIDSRLERLVDGELTADEYRDLLTALEEEPGGWRRCALAFLESQALARDLRGICSLTAVQAAPVNRPASTTARSFNAYSTLLAIAASFLLAFGLGVAAPSILRLVRQEQAGGGNLLTQQPGPNAASEGNIPGAVSSRLLSDEPRYIGDVQLVVDGDAEPAQDAARVPVYDVGQDVNRYLSREAPALGPEMIELLRRNGYDVRHEQQFFPAPLEDGRQIIVPVDGYQITPVSRRF